MSWAFPYQPMLANATDEAFLQLFHVRRQMQAHGTHASIMSYNEGNSTSTSFSSCR